MKGLFKILSKIKDCSPVIVTGLAFGVSAIGSWIPFLYDDFIKLMYARAYLVDPLSMFNPHAYPPFRPIVHLFFQINYRLFGITNYAGYHLSLALIHSLNTLLVYLIGSLLAREKRPGFVAAMLFAVFPSNLWSIWWIANAENALTLTLFLSSFYFFIKWTREGRGLFVVLTFVLAFLAFMSKMAAVLPLILLAYILIYKDEVSLNRWPRWASISAMFFMTFFCYTIPRVIRAGSEIFKVDFDTMYFKLAGEYGKDVQGVGRHMLDNFLSYFSKLFMFDRFTHPQMPFQTFFILVGVIILFLLIFLNLPDRKESYRPRLYLLFTLICISTSYFINKTLALNLISLFFFIYWLIFGTNSERLSAAWIFLIIIPFLFFRPAYFADERYLYFPNIGLTLLLGSVILRTVEQLAIKFDPHAPRRLTKRWLFISIGFSFALLTAIYGYDKYLDSLSIGRLEEKVHHSIYEDVPLGGKVVAINIPQSLVFKQMQLENMGRKDIRFDIFRTVDLDAFYLGDVYFIDYRPLQSEGQCNSLKDLHYEAEMEKDISTARFNIKTYNNIKGVEFNNGKEGFYRLKPEEKLTGFVAPHRGGKKRLIISCLELPKILHGAFPLTVEVAGGHKVELIKKANDEQRMTSFVGEVYFGGGVNKIEILNSSEDRDIFVSGIFLQEGE